MSKKVRPLLSIKRITNLFTNPYFLTILIFLTLTVIGSILLTLVGYNSSLDFNADNFANNFFMATSAICVTGLSVTNVSEMSDAGKGILVSLIFIGGLGMITLAQFVILCLQKLRNKDISFSAKYILREVLNAKNAKEVSKTLIITVSLAIIIQIIFAFIFSLYLAYNSQSTFTVGDAFAKGFFHSISSFNNAGFDIFGSSSLEGFKDDGVFMGLTMFLIILGGLGFLVIYNLPIVIYQKVVKKKSHFMGRHISIVFGMTILLIVLGFLTFKFNLKLDTTNAFFESITARTAGFASFDQSTLATPEHAPAFIIMIILMFIGGSSCSTAGGFKITTLYVLIKSMFANSLGKPIRSGLTKKNKKRITNETGNKAFTLFCLMILCLIMFFIAIVSIENSLGKDFDTKYILFEVTSALGTVGLSMGITQQLHISSQMLLCILMFIGRLGPITYLSVFRSNWLNNTVEDVRFTEANIYIG